MQHKDNRRVGKGEKIRAREHNTKDFNEEAFLKYIKIRNHMLTCN